MPCLILTLPDPDRRAIFRHLSSRDLKANYRTHQQRRKGPELRATTSTNPQVDPFRRLFQRSASWHSRLLSTRRPRDLELHCAAPQAAGLLRSAGDGILNVDFPTKEPKKMRFIIFTNSTKRTHLKEESLYLLELRYALFQG